MKIIYPVLICTLLFSCKKEKGNTGSKFQFPANTVSIQKIYDVGNAASAADIRAQIKFSSTGVLSDITGIRMIVSKTALTPEQAMEVASGNYYSFTATAGSAEQVAKPSAAVKAADGSAIANGIAYRLYVLILGKDDAAQLSPSVDFTLADKPVYAGNYTGIWNDALFKNFKVTMKVKNDYTGEIFYSDNFTPCCPPGTTNDGTVQITFNGTSITSFVVNQYLGNYNGGHCPATYTATGTIVDDIKLSIVNLAGSDCDGLHTPGTVLFTRQ